MAALRKWKILLSMGVLVAAILFSTVYLIHYYGETRPTTAAAGRSHPVTIHSRTVYLTSGEYGFAFVSHVIAIVSLGVFIGFALRPGHAK